MTCTFFGHRVVPDEIEPTLRSALIELIEKRGVTLFYVGNNGEFDAMVRRVLKELSARYPITCCVVLAYLPGKSRDAKTTDDADTILPEGIETVPKRFAVAYRNRWMVAHADVAVTYVAHDVGSGAAQFKRLAEKKGKTIVELFC